VALRNQIWEMDHKELPVLVLPPRGPAVKPWLTTVDEAEMHTPPVRYRRYYTRRNRGGGRTVVSVGPFGTWQIWAGMVIALTLFLAWPFFVGLPTWAAVLVAVAWYPYLVVAAVDPVLRELHSRSRTGLVGLGVLLFVLVLLVGRWFAFLGVGLCWLGLPVLHLSRRPGPSPAVQAVPNVAKAMPVSRPSMSSGTSAQTGRPSPRPAEPGPEEMTGSAVGRSDPLRATGLGTPAVAVNPPPPPAGVDRDARVPAAGAPVVRVFVDDDRGYLEWLRQHPRGRVLNAGRHPRFDYLVIHRATCGTISGSPARGSRWTSGDYLKACAGTENDLRTWARNITGGEPGPCGLCDPHHDDPHHDDPDRHEH
jgi:hypothetical protein